MLSLPCCDDASRLLTFFFVHSSYVWYFLYLMIFPVLASFLRISLFTDVYKKIPRVCKYIQSFTQVCSVETSIESGTLPISSRVRIASSNPARVFCIVWQCCCVQFALTAFLLPSLSIQYHHRVTWGDQMWPFALCRELFPGITTWVGCTDTPSMSATIFQYL
jgi:hypothetical protein